MQRHKYERYELDGTFTYVLNATTKEVELFEELSFMTQLRFVQKKNITELSL